MSHLIPNHSPPRSSHTTVLSHILGIISTHAEHCLASPADTQRLLLPPFHPHTQDREHELCSSGWKSCVSLRSTQTSTSPIIYLFCFNTASSYVVFSVVFVPQNSWERFKALNATQKERNMFWQHMKWLEIIVCIRQMDNWRSVQKWRQNISWSPPGDGLVWTSAKLKTKN